MIVGHDTIFCYYYGIGVEKMTVEELVKVTGLSTAKVHQIAQSMNQRLNEAGKQGAKAGEKLKREVKKVER